MSVVCRCNIYRTGACVWYFDDKSAAEHFSESWLEVLLHGVDRVAAFEWTSKSCRLSTQWNSAKRIRSGNSVPGDVTGDRSQIASAAIRRFNQSRNTRAISARLGSALPAADGVRCRRGCDHQLSRPSISLSSSFAPRPLPYRQRRKFRQNGKKHR